MALRGSDKASGLASGFRVQVLEGLHQCMYGHGLNEQE